MIGAHNVTFATTYAIPPPPVQKHKLSHSTEELPFFRLLTESETPVSAWRKRRGSC